MKPFFTVLSLLVLLLAGPAADPARAADETVRAGRVLVVANGYSPASVELARYYMLRRGLPPMNLLLVFPAGKLSVTPENFTEKIMKPISRRCALLGGRNIDYVVLCRDVPYRTGDFSAATAVMFGGVNRIQAGQGYHGQTRAFESCIPSHFINLLPTTILSAYTMDEAIALIDASQTVYNNPKTAGRWYFCDGAGPRGMRNPQIPTAMELLDRNGIRISHETTPNVESRSDILGQFTGDVWLKLAGNRYMPGSILDNLTSYGGCLLDNRGQADLLSFVQHGVCGAYGAVSEPTNSQARWADYSLPVRYLTGFSLAEAYLQSVFDWQFGIVVGDPLMSPFNPPPAMEIKLESDHFPPGTSAAGRLHITAPISGRGVSWAELWLNDQDLLLTYVPIVPQGTTALLEIRSGDRLLFSRKINVEGATRMPDLLRAFAAASDAPERLEIVPAGKRGDKLLVRWFPDPAANPAATSCTLTFMAGQKEICSFPQALKPAPLLQRGVVLDLGDSPPLPGDSVTVRLKTGEGATATFAAGQTVKEFADDLAAKLGALPAFARDAAWSAERRGPGPMPFGNIPSAQVWIVPRRAGAAADPPVLTTEVRRASAESRFASNLPEKPAAMAVPVALLAETVLQPFWPLNRIETAFKTPAARQWTGRNELRLIAGTPSGAETFTTATFDVGGADINPAFTVRTPILCMKDELQLEFTPGPGLAGAIPELLVDGRTACTWEAGARRGSLRAALPHIAPGTHQLQVQWIADARPRSPVMPFIPLARAAPQHIFVKHPLLEDTAFTPKQATAGKPFTLYITGGPYFHAGVRLLLDGRPLELRRHQQVGSQWMADVPALAPGPHTFAVEGNPARDAGGQFPDVLVVK